MANPKEGHAGSGAEWRNELLDILGRRWSMPVCAATAAVSLAIGVNQMVALRLDFKGLPTAPDVSPLPAAPQPGAVRLSFGAFVPQAARPAPVPSVATPSGASGKSSLPIELIGTFSASDGPSVARKSVAILQVTTGAREVDVMRVGEKWQGMELLAVERYRVRIRNLSTGAEEFIESETLKSAGGSAVKSVRKPAPSGDASGKILLSRSEVNRAIDNNTNVIFSWVDVQPYAPGGAVQGFQLSNIKPRGKPFFNLLGFREGDIVKRVNGVKMDSVEKAVGLWKDIHGKEQVTFSIQRQGVDQELNIVFKP